MATLVCIFVTASIYSVVFIVFSESKLSQGDLHFHSNAFLLTQM